MTEEIILFEDNNCSIEERFYFFMDLLVNNKSGTRTEQLCLFLIFYIQIISIFFDSRLKVFMPKNNTSDNILKYFHDVLRFVGIFYTHKSYYLKIIYVIPIIMIMITLFFIFVFYKTQKNSLYLTSHYILNMVLKIFIFIFYNIFLDFFTHLMCFNSKYNKYIEGLECSINSHLFIFFISLITTIYIISFIIFIFFFYNDSFYLSSSYYAQTCTKYNIFLILNCALMSIMYCIIDQLTIELFFFTNLFISIGFFIFYIKKIIYYDFFTNYLCGIFHIIYIWTTLFSIIFKYIEVSEKGLVWLITSIIFSFTFLNFKQVLDDRLFYNKPYHNITNINNLLYYLRKLIYMINFDSQDSELKSNLTGIIQIHIIECPNKNCILKNKEELFLPKTEKWSDRSKPFILDDILLSHFLIDINLYFLSINLYNPELLINLSYYYLNVIGNIIQSIYFLHEIRKMKLSIQEKFFFKRLKIAISKKLVEKLKYANETCENLDELNPSHYYKYEYYKEKFYSSIFKDLELLKTFWKKFSYNENKSVIDYNEIYKLTEKIMLCKSEIENLWKKLFSIYSGINEVFDFYIDYVDQINDDSFLKINLDSIKRKTENSTEHIHQNYYNMMFNNETGIVICNGDKGKEGLIEKVNHSFEKIFKYTFDEMRGMNISLLMPKVFEKQHINFMKEFIQIGKKYLINSKSHHTFGKDKDNSILYIRINLKIFPVLNQSVYFLGMINPEKIDDLIFIDSNFIIQGMSKKLTDKFQITNKYFFINNNIPFYMICKNFIHFFKTFMQDNQNENNTNTNNPIHSTEINLSEQGSELESSRNEIKKKDINIEINENIELEYEIKIPKFMLQYEKISKNKNLYYYLNKYDENSKHKSFNSEFEESINNIQNSLIEEQTPLISISGNYSPSENRNTPTPNPKINSPYNKSMQEKTIDNKGNDYYPSHKGTMSKQRNSIINNNEELVFSNKLKLYNNLFINGYFSRLEDIIEQDTLNGSIIYKFNFTFKKYIYHKNQTCFIIRCIDNKNEIGSANTISETEVVNIGKNIISEKEKIESLKNIYKIGEGEKKNINDNITEFGNYFLYDTHFQKMHKVYKDYMKKFSRIHGTKKHNSVLEDENSSQTLATSYNSDLSKINRIFEMKENILTNKKKLSNIYHLIFCIIFLVIGSIIFSAVFFLILEKIHSGLKLITSLNSKIYYIQLRTTGLSSIIISLKTLYDFKNNENFSNFHMNTFIEDQNEYFNYLKEKGINWTKSTHELINHFEGNLTHTANKYNIDLWESIPKVYPISFPKNDSESYIQGLLNIIVISQTILSLDFFDLDYKITDINEKLELIYDTFLAIENNIDFIIPTGLNKISDILNLFIKYNEEKIQNVYYAVIIFLVFVFILEIIYLIILYKTHKYIAFGFFKIEKISQDNIENMIQKIKNFSDHYKKRNEILLSMNDNLLENNTTLINNSQQSQNLFQNSRLRKVNSDFSLESKKVKKLNIFNKNYIHFPLIYIICIIINLLLFLICQNAIKSNISMIKIQTYLFGRFLSVSCSTNQVKCVLAKCKLNNSLDCFSFLNENLSFTLYKSFKKFPTLSHFYNEYFLKDACAAIHDGHETNENYYNCLNSSMVKLINNTNSILDYVQECLNNLLGEYKNNKELNSSYSSFSVFNSDTFNKMEEAYFHYVIPVVKKMDKVIITALNNFVKKEYNIAIFIITVFIFMVLIFFFYIYLFFIKELEYSIKVSKNIFRIIPSNIISANQDLENWLESINNES